jgi:VWFA-related protein
MFRLFLPTLAVIVFSFAAATAQAVSSTPPGDIEDTVKISTSLIQMDVVVTDKDKKPVTDLGIGDFQIFQDGKPQTIKWLTFVNAGTSERTVLAGKNDSEVQRLLPPSGIRAKSGRIITFVLDDGNCLATAEGTRSIIYGMKKFVAERMLPDDRVAIYRTQGGTSLMQLYTSNKEVLKRKLDKMNLIRSGACNSAYDALRDDSTIKYSGKEASTFESKANKEFKDDNEKRERDNQVIGTIGVLNFVVDRLKNAPQRKLIFFLSEGLATPFETRAADALRELADKASRSSVVINTLSAKGVTISGMLSAQDDVLPGITGGPDNTLSASEARRNEERVLGEGLSYLAYATGGEYSRQNYMDVAVGKILAAHTSYYLLGYEPTDETFKGKDFHKIDVKVTRPGLLVISRNGFFGRTDKESQPVYKTPDSPLYQAISTPFQDDQIDVRLTTMYGQNPAEGSYVRALLHVPGSGLTLTNESNGNKKAVIDVVAVTLDERGRVVDEFNRTYPILIPEQGVETVVRNGLDFSSDFVMKKPGVYTLRVAVRDNNSKRLGSAGDFVEVPDVQKGRFLVSGLITTPVTKDRRPVVPQTRTADRAFAPVFSTETASVRQYNRDSSLAFAYSVYNAKASPQGNPNLTRQVTLFKNGEPIAELPEETVRTNATAGERIDDFGILRLGPDIEPGEYVLQIVVRDKTANRDSSQWIDFEVL